MKRSLRSLLLAVSFLVGARDLLAQCGVERWSVKTGTDPDAGLVNLSSSSSTTIATMRSWTAPNPIPANNRVSPFETTQWVLNATLTQYKLESDSDYHVVISDASGNTMITEIPSPNCVGSGSPFAAGIQNARNEFDAKLTATTSFQTANIPVQIRGVGMFDFLHGQTGVAPNGIEIHPVLDIIFNPGTTPDFAMSETPTSLTLPQGTAGTSTITTSVTGGFNSAISLSAGGLPGGATASFTPSSIAAPGSGSSTMTVTTGTATPTGSYTLTITGTGGGQTHTTSLTLTVTASGGGGSTITDGDFETGTLTGWTTGGVKIPVVSTAQHHTGSNSALLGGNVAPEPNGDSFLYQSIAIPSNATSASLSFWYWPATTDTLTYDWQEAQIRNSSGTMLAQVFKIASNTQTWTQQTFDLLPYKGQTIQVYFNVHGDGFGDLTYMYLDDVGVTINTGISDTTPPSTSVTAPANGATVSGTNTITATASDNVGVTKMEIYVDGALKTSNSNATSLSFAWNTTTVANGSHAIVSKAYDAAANVGTSSTVTVTVSNGGTSQQLLGNPGFETGSATPWVTTTGVVSNSSSEPPHSGSWDAWLDGYGTTHTDTLYQQVTIPSTATSATLTFWLHIDTAETSTTTPYDTLKLQIRNSSGAVLATLATYSNLNAATGYAQKSFNLNAYIGQTIQVYFVGAEDSSYQTSFVLDDFALNVQ